MEKPSRIENHRFDGFKKDVRCCLTSDDPNLHFKMLKKLAHGRDSKTVSRFPNLSSRDISDARSLQYKHFFRLPPTLQLSQNNLSGPIWEDFGKLKKLHVANLNGNRLSGTIPSSLSEMTSLEVLDLSNNRFSGSIPESLQKLTFLSMFSVPNSNLSGRIPSGGQFQTFPDSSYEGNDFFLLPLDSMSSRYTRRKTTKYQ
ncbi:hypothetical protein F2Q68_00034063 [Brassica cretica]|uniref:Uncharacterized protein n=1 Tax=Brassica cretica TaxID=69181 RepID=A0A8S9GYT2_BRACR|nr:hypothetical protein F2Q68_00034063 [Brassica cretica]